VPMTDDEFDAFVARCVERLEYKQADLKVRFGLGDHARWAFDQATGLLRFMDAQGIVRVEADVTDIGSYSTARHTWRWGWANRPIVEAQRAKSSKLRGLYDQTGLDVFRMQAIDADEGMPWELTAMAVEYLDAIGCYRGPAKHLHVFLAIERIRHAG